MKKVILILSLVLSMAGSVNAVMSLGYSDGQITVTSDTELYGGICAGIGIIGPSQLFPFEISSLRTAGEPISKPDIYLYSGADLLDYGIPYNQGLMLVYWGDPV